MVGLEAQWCQPRWLRVRTNDRKPSCASRSWGCGAKLGMAPMTAVWPPGGSLAALSAKVPALPGASEVLVSQTVKDLTAGSGLMFEDASEHELKGVPDLWRLFRVTS